MSSIAATRLLLALLMCQVLWKHVSPVRFGDRIAPRVPLYASRANTRAPPPELADYTEENADQTSGENDKHEEKDFSRSREQPVSPQAESGQRAPSRTEAHRLEMSTEYFVVPEKNTEAPIMLSSQFSSSVSPVQTTPNPRKFAPPPAGALRDEPWAVPILSLACVIMVIITSYEAFAIYSARRTIDIHRQTLLDQILLLGLFSCAALAAALTASPTPFACGAVRFGVGFAYALVFASLLVKCVTLLGRSGGARLPSSYQGLLLFFAVTIQVAIGAQWLGGAPPHVDPGPPPVCKASLGDTLLSLAYDACLIASTSGVALRVRRERAERREATRVCVAAGLAGLAWLCWAAAAAGAAERHRDACLAGGLLATTVVVFASTFAAEGVRRAGKDVIDMEREDGLSSLDRAGSAYSPSFFHFKPVKYGVVGAPLPAPPTIERKEPPPPTDWYSASHFYARPYHPSFFPSHFHPQSHSPMHYHYPHFSPYHCFVTPQGILLRSDDGHIYTTLEPTFSSNPNVYFHRTEGAGGVHPGMMY